MNKEREQVFINDVKLKGVFDIYMYEDMELKYDSRVYKPKLIVEIKGNCEETCEALEYLKSKPKKPIQIKTKDLDKEMYLLGDVNFIDVIYGFSDKTDHIYTIKLIDRFIENDYIVKYLF